MAEAPSIPGGGNVPHIGPRCSYCGCLTDGPHSSRCSVTKFECDPLWTEYKGDIVTERDALRSRAVRLEAALEAALSGFSGFERYDDVYYLNDAEAKVRAALKGEQAR